VHQPSGHRFRKRLCLGGGERWGANIYFYVHQDLGRREGRHQRSWVHDSSHLAPKGTKGMGRWVGTEEIGGRWPRVRPGGCNILCGWACASYFSCGLMRVCAGVCVEALCTFYNIARRQAGFHNCALILQISARRDLMRAIIPSRTAGRAKKRGSQSGPRFVQRAPSFALPL
jgi:hypothetical protein